MIFHEAKARPVPHHHAHPCRITSAGKCRQFFRFLFLGRSETPFDTEWVPGATEGVRTIGRLKEMLKTRKAAAMVGLGFMLASGSALVGDASANAVAPAHTATISAAKASSCFAGHSSFSGRRGTSYMTTNCATVQFRAKVLCKSAFGDTTGYGHVISGLGSSYYTCNYFKSPNHVNAQYFNGMKWVDLPF